MKVGNQIDSIHGKMDYYSDLFLGATYDGGPLGEGVNGLYDQDPLQSFTKFDCTTFVETIMALSLSKSRRDFREQLKDIRYKNGVVRYTERNHFISLDWIKNNSKILKDITSEVGREDTLFAKTIIDKKGWYQSKKAKDLKLAKELNEAELVDRVASLNAEGNQFNPVEVKTPYVPLSRLFVGNLVNFNIIQRIPHGSIISMVRPNWDLKKYIGTHLNVSHQGIAITKKDGLYLRHASTKGTVREESFIEYFKRYRKSKTLKGFNVLSID